MPDGSANCVPVRQSQQSFSLEAESRGNPFAGFEKEVVDTPLTRMDSSTCFISGHRITESSRVGGVIVNADQMADGGCRILNNGTHWTLQARGHVPSKIYCFAECINWGQ